MPDIDWSKLGHLSDEAFIERAYALILRRRVDPQGLDHYLGRLWRGDSRRAVWASLLASREAHLHAAPPPPLAAAPLNLQELLRLDGQAFVAGAYQLILNRPADPGGLSHYSEALGAGASKAMVVKALLSSAEFANLGTDMPELAAYAASANHEMRWMRMLQRIKSRLR